MYGEGPDAGEETPYGAGGCCSGLAYEFMFGTGRGGGEDGVPPLLCYCCCVGCGDHRPKLKESNAASKIWGLNGGGGKEVSQRAVEAAKWSLSSPPGALLATPSALSAFSLSTRTSFAIFSEYTLALS